jgi:phosphate transport system protein
MPNLLLQREIDTLNKLILQLGGQVEENLRQGVQSISTRNSLQAYAVQDEDEAVDMLEVQVEEECLKLLALHQPVASDLRYIISVLKINGDLERIGDLSKHLGQHAYVLSRGNAFPIPEPLHVMASIAREMLTKSLNALIARDVNACQRILHQDKQVDACYGEMHVWFEEGIKQNTPDSSMRLYLYLAAKDLERIADHACNIAEDVIYLVSGEIVRHHDLALAED